MNNYDDMVAGRELDALVAEKVMGWTRHPEPMHPTDNRTINGVLYCRAGFPGINGGSAGYHNVVPDYSTDIADAWLVVEKLREKRCIRVRSVHDESPNKWVCIFDPLHSTRFGTEVQAYAETAPLAICRAALKAVATQKE